MADPMAEEARSVLGLFVARGRDYQEAQRKVVGLPSPPRVARPLRSQPRGRRFVGKEAGPRLSLIHI
eukprot:1152413-Alexandrium_andersonii.AAC.1